MSIIPDKLSGKRFIVLFALLLFSPLVFQPETQTVMAQIRIPLPGKSDKVKIDASTLAKIGPVIPAIFNMSNFTVQGLVQGKGWLIAIDYELEADSTAEVTITTRKAKQPFVIQLSPAERKEVIRELPEEFGDKPQLGELSFRAFKTGPGEKKLARFFLYGLAVGRKGVAVGSILIDQLRFQPGSIRPKLKEKASYSFRSLSDFDMAAVEFSIVREAADGVIRPQRVATETIKSGVRRNESVAKDWDGKDSKGKISQGAHQFHVRVWRGIKSGGDWVSVGSKQMVKVE